MRSNYWIPVVVLSLFPIAWARDDARKPKVSSEPLTKEQIAVYHAVLQHMPADSRDILNLANMTEPNGQSNRLFNGSCPKSSDPQVAEHSAMVVHRIGSATIVNLNIVLVDRGQQEEKIKKDDSAIPMKRVIDDHLDVPQKQIDDATERAVNNGLVTLSEISFNKKHNRALVSFSFVCGELCGYGNVLVLQRVGEKWEILKICEEWVS